MKRATVLLGIALLLAGCAPPDPQVAFDEGEKYLDQGLLDKAIVQYELAVKYKPDFTQAWSSMAQAQFSAENFPAAAVAAAKAVELDPKDSSMRMFLGIAQLLSRDYAGGQKTFEELLVTHPGYGVAELNLEAALALQDGRMTHGCFEKLSEGLGSGRSPTDLAMRPTYEAVVEQCPDFLEARYNLGLVQLQDVKKDEARELFQQVVEADPGFARAYRALGMMASREGDLEEAVEQYTKAVEADPKLSVAHFELGAISARMPGRQSQRRAVEHLKIYLEQEPEGGWASQARELLEKRGVKP